MTVSVDDRINTLHIVGGYALGGAELFFTRLVNALHARGHPTTAVTCAGSLIETHLADDVPTYHSPMRSVIDVPGMWRIRRLIRQIEPAIVQTYMGRATRLTHVPGRSKAVHVARLGGYYKVGGFRHADAWIGITAGLCDYLVRNGLPRQRVHHIGNFVLPEAARPAAERAALRAALGVPDEAWLLLAVGRLHPVKGYTDLLQAAAALPETIAGRPWRIAVVGDGPLALSLGAEARALNLTDNLIWCGWKEDTGIYYQAADLFICPSRHEALGNVVLEAWSHGTPVLSTASEGPAEFTQHGESAWITPVADPDALRAGIEHLLADDALRAALTAGGQRTLAARFSEAAVLDQYLALYSGILSSGR